MNHLHCHTFLEDQDYILEIQSGGPGADRAISCLYLKYRKRAYSYMANLISKHAEYKGETDDIIQDSFIIMIDKIRDNSYEVKSLVGYWIGIGKMLFLNQLKKDRRIVYINDVEEQYGYEHLTPESILFEKEEQYKLESVFAHLGPRCKEILMLWLSQYTMVEIAQKMNLSSDGMARKIKFECFKKLKALIKSQYKSSSRNS